MPDSLFFPLSALVAAGFVFLALQPFADRPPTGPVSAGNRNAEDILVEGRELHRFVPGTIGGLSILSEETDEPGQEVLRITRLADQIYDDPRQGPHIVLAEDVEQALASRPIEVIVEARSTGEVAATEFQINYLARPNEESGWTTFTLTPEFAPYALQWTTPERTDSLGYDYLGIRPVAPDERRSVEIRSVRVHATGLKILPQLE